MGLQDRDWYRAEQRRKATLAWDERTGELRFAKDRSKRRWRWPYRLQLDLPWWVREYIPYTAFMGVVALLYWLYTQYVPGSLP